MAFCDQLETTISTADTTRARLLKTRFRKARDAASTAITEAAE